MRTRRLLILMMVVLAAFAVMMTSCAKDEPEEEPVTFESFIAENPNIRESVDKQLVSDKSSDISYEINGNDIVYTYELSGMEDMTEETVNSDIVTESLEAGLKDQAEYFKGVANSLAGLSEVEGIRVIVNYTFDGEEILSETFEADPLPSDGESEEDGDS